MLLAFALGILVASGAVTVALVALIAACLGVVGAFDLPTRQAFIVEMVGPEDLPSAIALNASIFNTARVVGPAVAGTLVAKVGEAPCFFLNGASYLAVLWALATMRLPPTGRGAATTASGFRSGLRYVRAHPVLRPLLLALGVVSGLSLQVNVLMPVVAQRFGAAAQGYGLLLTAFGAGAILSALRLASRRHTYAQHRRNLLFGLGAFGAGLLALAASPRLEAALVCHAVAGLGMIRFTATTNTLLQLVVDDRYRGRVMGLHTVMFMGTAPIGSLLLGWLAQRWQAPAALLVAGGAPLVVAAWLATRLGRGWAAAVRLPTY
jgi:MFS family permease